MSVEVQYEIPHGSVLSRLFAPGWRRWKKYATRQRAEQAVETLNRNHRLIGWRFRLAPTTDKESER